MIVELVNGNVYVALMDTCMDKFTDMLMRTDGSGYVDLDMYDNELRNMGAPEFSVMTVSKPDTPSDMIDHNGDLVFSRL